ncbi:MAG TPA: diadenylate cyclase [Methanocorpusculum sp.]|nr:diadenylate cyclase [Methanocorpusculum sp.]HJJ51435.1 diadenylate cyclase [Methanocorpusculum sp.]
MREKNRNLMIAADNLAKTVNALAVISFLPKDEGISIDTPTVHVVDIQPEILRDHNMATLVNYCSNQIVDAVLQYKILTNTDSGTVVAAFPYAILIYDVESKENSFSVGDYAHIVDPEALHAVLMLAIELAHDGREGRSVGTAFILGDIDELKRWSHQGVLNPYAGHPIEVRDVKMRENWESVKEFSQLDGVFILDKNGIIEASGRYLDADSRDANLQSGLGGRHLATAAITKVVQAVGIVVSESGGVIRVFVGGKSVAQIRTDVKLVL